MTIMRTWSSARIPVAVFALLLTLEAVGSVHTYAKVTYKNCLTARRGVNLEGKREAFCEVLPDDPATMRDVCRRNIAESGNMWRAFCREYQKYFH
ncbi:unnamed protein product [Darwinula stevensoni]|uniref:Uncharacterized protein n=1 Tax=Darwinula stevensoni TaxID=69355 RepID=A0A7R9FR81_9CRUS|nr:unnamed protein product [Darwinula stevensoni]CAG0901184.1 unnamed protein product [Darwinula stevensoni]